MKLGKLGIDTELIQRYKGFTNSSSLVTTRPDGHRPALHKREATDGFFIDDSQIDRVLDTKILHVGGVGLMNRMDDAGRTEEVMAEAKRRGVITTLDVFTSTAADLPKVERLLPYTDYFIPSEEEARALSGLHDNRDRAQFLLNLGAGCVVLTLGAKGAFYLHRDGTEFYTPSFQIEVKCTCSCGDCFNVALPPGCIWGGRQKNVSSWSRDPRRKTPLVWVVRLACSIWFERGISLP